MLNTKTQAMLENSFQKNMVNAAGNSIEESKSGYLVIYWPNSVERIDIQLSQKPSENEITNTLENWNEPKICVTYNTTSKREINEDNGLQTIRIKYEQEKNTNILSNIGECGVSVNDISWGETTITISKDLMSANVVWSEDEDKNHNCKLYLAGQTIREMIDTARAQRDAAFREAIFECYKKCAITGEATKAALDAAHIIEVQDNGSDHPQNGILLRADIHRLFDSGLIKIDPENGKIEPSEQISSDYYEDLFKDKCIDNNIMNNIRDNLEKRNKLRTLRKSEAEKN